MKSFGILEPLYNLLSGHGEKLDQYMGEIRADIGTVARTADIVLSKVRYDQYTTQSNRENADAEGTAVIELTPNDGFSWVTTRIALTGTKGGACAVYVGSIAPENLIDVFSDTGITANDPKYFVPYTVPLTFHFYEQEPNQPCTVNMQAELLPSGTPTRAHTGRDLERIDVPRVKPVPSPSPFLSAS